MTHVDLEQLLGWPKRIESEQMEFAWELHERQNTLSKRCRAAGLSEILNYLQLVQYGPILAWKKAKYSRKQIWHELNSIWDVMEYYAELEIGGMHNREYVIKKTHGILMQYTTSKLDSCVAGAYRTRSANITRYWGSSSSVKIKFPPAIQMITYITDILNNSCRDKLNNSLIEVGILYAKLILMHPFIDGNGRSIRCFLSYLLSDCKLVDGFMFHLFVAFEASYKKHNAILDLIIERQNNIWLDFFLERVEAWIDYLDLWSSSCEQWLERWMHQMEKVGINRYTLATFFHELRGSAVINLRNPNQNSNFNPTGKENLIKFLESSGVSIPLGFGRHLINFSTEILRATDHLHKARQRRGKFHLS